MMIDFKTVVGLQNRRPDVKYLYKLLERVAGASQYGLRSVTSHRCCDQPALPSLCGRHVGSAQSAYVRKRFA